MTLINQQIENNKFFIDYENAIIEKNKLKESDQNDLIMAKSTIDRGMNNTPYFDEIAQLDDYRYRFLKANINQYKNSLLPNPNQARHIVNYCKAILDLGVLNYSYNLKTGSNVNYGVN